jgi:hypothetical protein
MSANWYMRSMRCSRAGGGRDAGALAVSPAVCGVVASTVARGNTGVFASRAAFDLDTIDISFGTG